MSLHINLSLSRLPSLYRPRAKETNRLNSPDFITNTTHCEYYNFTAGGKKPSPVAFSSQSLDTITPKSSFSYVKRAEFPETSPFPDEIPISTTSRTKRMAQSKKDLKLERTQETDNSLLDTSIVNSIPAVSPSNRGMPKKNSSKLKLKDICDNISKIALPLNEKQRMSDEFTVNEAKHRSPIRIDLDSESEYIISQSKISPKAPSLASIKDKAGKMNGLLQKIETDRLPARHRPFEYKPKNDNTVSKISFDESMRLEKVKSMPSIQEVSKGYSFAESFRRLGAEKMKTTIVQSSLTLMKTDELGQSPVHREQDENPLLKPNETARPKTKLSVKPSQNPIPLKKKTFNSRVLKENPPTFSRPATSNQGIVRTLKDRKNTNVALEVAQSLPDLKESIKMRISSPSKAIKKSPKKNSPTKPSPSKKIWSSAHDQVLAAIEKKTPEQIFGGKLIRPPENPLTSNPRYNRENEGEEVFEPPKRDFKKVRKAFIEAVKKLRLLKLTPKDLYQKVFSSKPYENENAKQFIHAAKLGNVTGVELLLAQNKYLVYDFDNAHQTALHWAVKRGHQEVIESLIKFGADVNAKDLIGRTPLYFAIQGNHIEIMKLLLFSKCDPWSPLRINYTTMMENNPTAKYYLSKARQIYIMMAMTPLSQRQEVWNNQSWLLQYEPRNSRINTLRNSGKGA